LQDFYAALQTAGMPSVPAEFSVVPQHQAVDAATLAEISEFIGVFDRVTAREAWRSAAMRDAPAVVRPMRPQTCFFSAWDFHLPPDGGLWLIEFNDNGSGFMFAAIINAVYYTAAGLEIDSTIAMPWDPEAFGRHITSLIVQEADAFSLERPVGRFLILDDAESIRQGKFRKEHQLLRDVLRQLGWRAEIGAPGETRWDGRDLLFENQPVSFVVNRSTDFFWQADEFYSLRDAYREGRVYVAPNPFTYSTRSDKRLLEWLSLPNWDKELKIEPRERAILNSHVPETHLLRPENAALLAQRKQEFIFKPVHGFAGRGLLSTRDVGEDRLRRLVRQGKSYVAQAVVPKRRIETDGTPLWTDLRVWAYRGRIYHLSGRGSPHPDRHDLAPPGGWLPTYRSA
jgi:hypothetical protein